MTSKLRELLDEFRNVVAGQRPWSDAIGPPLIFLLIHLWFGGGPAIVGAVGFALLLTLIRLIRGRMLRYALGGLGGVVVAALAALLLEREGGFFLPGLVRGGMTSLVCLVSVLVRRPLVAWSSHLARRWPLSWYWHPLVLPAYSEVTWIWFLYFAGRLILQLVLFERGATNALAIGSLVLGWPVLIILLAGTYLYGQWRLRTLRGPSVDEFVNQTPPPWRGQQKGF